MVRIPGRCRSCGKTVANPPLIEVVRSANLHVSNAVHMNGCPHCGGDVESISGNMSVTDGAIEMLSGPQWSWDLVEELRLTLKRVVEEPPEDPIAPIEALHPRLGTSLRRTTSGWTRGQVLALIGVILAALTWGGITPSDIGGWLRDVEDQIADVIREAQKTGPPKPPQPGNPERATPSTD